MKQLLTILFCLASLLARAQKPSPPPGSEKTNRFQIVDEETKAAVPIATVSIIRAGLSITTEADGIFIIPGDLSKLRDTVLIHAQAYAPFKIAQRSLHGRDTINLTRLIINQVKADGNYTADSILNDFNRKHIAYYAGLHTETELFNYQQLAQQFYVQQTGVLLRKIWVNRLRFTKAPDLTGLEFTKFRIRVYDVNPTTGAPGAELCHRVIEVKNRDSDTDDINVEKYNIVIPGKSFFVAVEWMRDYVNMSYSLLHDAKQNKKEKLITYRPLLGISPIKGKKLNIWGLNFKREWKPYNYFYPRGTDLAIRASVKY